MALIEIDGDELAKLQAELTASRGSKVILDKIGNSKHRRALLEAMKEVQPDLNIPEIDAGKPALDEVTKLRAELDAMRQESAAEKKERAKAEREAAITLTINEKRAMLRAQGYQDEGIERVEKLMQERGLTDYEAAAALLERSAPPDEVVIPNYDKSWGYSTPEDNDEDHKLLIANKNSHRAWQSKQIKKFFDEKRRGVLKV